MPTQFPAAMRSLQRSSATFSGKRPASRRHLAFDTLSIADLPDGGASTAIDVVDPFYILPVKVA
jgi:hypothetical protein